MKFFALIELHRLWDLVYTWQRHTSELSVSGSQVDWGVIPDRPPLLHRAWVCREGRVQVEGVQLSLEEEEAAVASSDDDEGGELEEVPEAEDLVFLATLDHVIRDED